MASSRTSPVSWRRRVLAGAALGWILIVVAGAGSSTDDSLLGVDNLHIVWIILLLVAVVLSIVLLIYLNPFANEWVEPDKPRRGIGFWIVASVFFAALVWGVGRIGEPALDDEAADELAGLFSADVDTTPDEAAPETVAQATDILLLVVGVAALGGVWFILRQRSKHNDDLDDENSDLALEKDLLAALEQASRELGAITDPRTAVLRSYAVLETVLASHGLSRPRAETATEHLRRALRNLRLDSAPLIQLGQLYEVARFSEHPITVAQQADAARALDQTRVSLESLT